MRAVLFTTALVLVFALGSQARAPPDAKCDAPVNQIACQVDEDGFITNVWLGAWGNNKEASCPVAVPGKAAAKPSWGKALPVQPVCRDADTPAPGAAEFLAIPNTRKTMGVLTEVKWVASKDYSSLRRITFTVAQYDRVEEAFTGNTATIVCGDKSAKLDKNPTDGWKAPKDLVFGAVSFKCNGASTVYPTKACFTQPAWYPSKNATKAC